MTKYEDSISFYKNLKQNANCKAEEKNGTGPGSCSSDAGKKDGADDAKAAKAAYLKRMGITDENLEKREHTVVAKQDDPPEVSHAKGVLAAKNLGGPVSMKYVNAAIKTLQKHGYIIRGSEIVQEPKKKAHGSD